MKKLKTGKDINIESLDSQSNRSHSANSNEASEFLRTISSHDSNGNTKRSHRGKNKGLLAPSNMSVSSATSARSGASSFYVPTALNNKGIIPEKYLP